MVNIRTSVLDFLSKTYNLRTEVFHYWVKVPALLENLMEQKKLDCEVNLGLQL